MAISSNYRNGSDAISVLNPDGSGKPAALPVFAAMSPAYTERFEAHVTFPGSMTRRLGGEGNMKTPPKDLAELQCALLCEEVQIPGMTLSNKELNLGNWQFYRNTNIGFLGNEINITFYTDANWELRHVFESWMDHCVSATSKEVAWPDDSFGEILVNQLDKQGKIRAQWQLMECTPKVLNLVPLAMGAVSIARTTLIISSAYWKSRAIDVNLNKREL